VTDIQQARALAQRGRLMIPAFSGPSRSRRKPIDLLFVNRSAGQSREDRRDPRVPWWNHAFASASSRRICGAGVEPKPEVNSPLRVWSAGA